MIRIFNEKDLNNVMQLWLEGNVEAHSFINLEYWQDNYDFVQALIPSAEVWVYEAENNILGFIGLGEGKIYGLFVRASHRSCGIGKSLLEHVKTKSDSLELSVYQKNHKAFQFYQREGFEIQSLSEDISTKEQEYTMCWSRN
ncbi:MAG: N-acetyltransferase [Brevinema sp.]